MSSNGAQKIIVDCDPGVDDALAIAMVLGREDLDLLALTTVYGNTSVEQTTRNALGLLALAGRDDIQVAKGACRPIASGFHGGVPHVHGQDGLGDGGLLEGLGLADPSGTSAAQTLIELAHAAPGEITIVALGPLTNLALGLQLDPTFRENVGRIIVMGGNCFSPGNATPAAEANMWNDPESADLVLGENWEVSMIGLDVTHSVTLSGARIEEVRRHESLGARICKEALPVYQRFFEVTNGIDGIFCHDPTAIAFLLQPELFRTRSLPLRVETMGMSRGKTWPSLGDTDDATPIPWVNRPEVEIATDVQAEAVADLIAGLLTKQAA